jgi:hypothetical protein
MYPVAIKPGQTVWYVSSRQILLDQARTRPTPHRERARLGTRLLLDVQDLELMYRHYYPVVKVAKQK